MTLKEITLLSEEEYTKYKSIISNANLSWWLKTPHSEYHDGVRVVDHYGYLGSVFCYYDISVRPALKVELEPADPLFWYKAGSLVGSKIKYGEYKWTILAAEGGELYTLCDEFIAEHRFNKKSNNWETSELKKWLETEGIRRISKT